MSRVEANLKLGDRDDVLMAKAELAVLLSKKNQAQVVMARLNRIFAKAANMATIVCRRTQGMNVLLVSCCWIEEP